MLKKHKSLFVILVSLFTILNLNAQSKVEKIEGKVKKIIIETEKGKTTFENEEAEELFIKIKKNKESKVDVFYFDSKNDNENEKDSLINIKIKKFKNDAEKVIVLKGKSEFIDDEKDLEIKLNKGEMKVIEIKNINGEKTEKIYEGDEAKKYLEEKKENVTWFDKDESKIIISTDKGKQIKEKRIKVIIEKDEKKED